MADVFTPRVTSLGWVSSTSPWASTPFYDGTASAKLDQRYYTPGFGRFLSADQGPPVASNPESWNRYNYSWGDPVNLNDSNGMLPRVVEVVGGALRRVFSSTEEGTSPNQPIWSLGRDPLIQPDGRYGFDWRDKMADRKDCLDGVTLSDDQRGLLGDTEWTSLTATQQASFLNQTGALAAAGIGLSGLALLDGRKGIEADRLSFAPGSTDTFRQSVEAAVADGRFLRDGNISAMYHPGMADYGVRQNRQTLALQIGRGDDGGFADIDIGNPMKPFGAVIHGFEVVYNKISNTRTSPFFVGRQLGKAVTGHDCK